VSGKDDEPNRQPVKKPAFRDMRRRNERFDQVEIGVCVALWLVAAEVQATIPTIAQDAAVCVEAKRKPAQTGLGSVVV
jgi:hypothetical protein